MLWLMFYPVKVRCKLMKLSHVTIIYFSYIIHKLHANILCLWYPVPFLTYHCIHSMPNRLWKNWKRSPSNRQSRPAWRLIPITCSTVYVIWTSVLLCRLSNFTFFYKKYCYYYLIFTFIKRKTYQCERESEHAGDDNTRTDATFKWVFLPFSCKTGAFPFAFW